MKQFLDFYRWWSSLPFISFTISTPPHGADCGDRRRADLQLGALPESGKNGADHFVLVAVFGGLTIFFHNDEFIKWKVTVIYACSPARCCSASGDENALIQRMLGKELSLPQA
ncbi:septation protein IspZ [Klebsiella pneumoniae]|uniref:septation protein IspZ n=1 Tax=Klebsiella pneumoniae TaxID=573 RepID=UPI00158EB1C8|nr:septation protein IspZ [Klebsiella pneumoniae]